MQLARWVGGLGGLLVSTAFAAQGDDLLVTGSNVNVRAGPSTEAGILTRVGLNEPAIEMRRQGQWVEVKLPDQDVLGWIHGSLLGSAPPASAANQAQGGQAQGDQSQPPQDRDAEVAALTGGAAEERTGDAQSPATTAALTPDAEAAGTPLERFRREVAYFNNRAVAAAGIDLFTGVEPLGDGGVQVVTTDAWATMSTPGQQSYVNALFGRWQVAAGGDRPLRLQIVDHGGVLMMERTGP